MSEEESFVILGSCSPTNSINSIVSVKQQPEQTNDNTTTQPILIDGKLDAKELESALSPAGGMCSSAVSDKFISSTPFAQHNGYDVWKRNGEQDNQPSVVSVVASLQKDDTSSEVEVKATVNDNENISASQNVNAQQQQQISATPDSLAVNFIMGQVPADALKASILSQFPSVPMEACAELQTFVSDYLRMKNLMIQINDKMGTWLEMKKQIYSNEVEYKKKLEQCQQQIATVRNENINLKRELEAKIQQMQISFSARNTEFDELVRSNSEKTAQIANMRTLIEKREEQEMASFQFVSKNGKDEMQPKQTEYVNRLEYESAVKELEHKMSQLLAEKLEINDMQKQYIDEIDCLKVNLTASEELIKQLRADIALLKANDKENAELFDQYATQRNKMSEELTLLRHQVEVYSRDFQLERTAREEMAGEKAQLLDDLRLLQHKNQQLAEQVGRLEERLNTVATQRSGPLTVPAKTAAPSSAAEVEPEHRCPVCEIVCSSLTSLQIHVNQCLDQNVHT